MKVARRRGALQVDEGTARGRPFFVGARGFTLVELVVVISIVAILSVYAAARFSGNEFNARAATDRLFAQITFARKVAIGQRRAVCVHLTAAQSVLLYDDAAPGTCNPGTDVAAPSGPAPFTVAAGATPFGPAGIFRFDALGRYRTANDLDPGGALTVTVSGANVFVLERETGYVHP
jgi:prepilin-type N-terminal cleavage/methylation domain-containing protein